MEGRRRGAVTLDELAYRLVARRQQVGRVVLPGEDSEVDAAPLRQEVVEGRFPVPAQPLEAIVAATQLRELGVVGVAEEDATVAELPGLLVVLRLDPVRGRRGGDELELGGIERDRLPAQD